MLTFSVSFNDSEERPLRLRDEEVAEQKLSKARIVSNHTRKLEILTKALTEAESV